MTSETAQAKFERYSKIVDRDIPDFEKAHEKRKRSPGTGEILIVDLDGTLLKKNSFFEVVKKKAGVKKAVELLQKIVTSKAREADEEIISLGITKKDYQTLARSWVKNGQIRQDILLAIKYFQRVKKNAKVFLVTKSSQTIADTISGELGFDGALGQGELFDKNGVLCKILPRIGDKTNPKTGVKTKVDAVAELCRKRGIPFKAKNTTVLTDSVIGDAIALKESGLAIHYIQLGKAIDSKIAKKYKLKDRVIFERRPDKRRLGQREIERTIRSPQLALKRPERISNIQKKYLKRTARRI